MTKNRSLSVIIPAYRCASTIGRALDSVLIQTCAVSEIIVVDDGSPDGLASVVTLYGDRVTYLRKENGGAASARNLGIERATGEFIAFLDADDYWEPTKVERQLGVFHQHPEVGLVAGTAFQEVPGRTRIPPLTADPRWYDRVLRAKGEMAFQLGTLVTTPTVTIRREMLGNERFPADLDTAEDRDLWVRLACRQPCYLMSEPLATVVLEEGSLSRTNADRDYSNMLRVVRRNAQLLGKAGMRSWEAKVYGCWAACHLGSGNAAAAIRPALSQLRRRPFSALAWWIVMKSMTLAALRRKRIADHTNRDRQPWP
jgi:glycosyltransferase involved in cell wall biosynthesis